jgi:hypothetical protein
MIVSGSSLHCILFSMDAIENGGQENTVKEHASCGSGVT